MTGGAALTVRVALRTELRRVNDAYATLGYRGGSTPEDTVVLAERGGELVGLVRRTGEQGVTLLRGMYVAPHAQRQGVGSALLSRFVALLDGRDCYCLPYTHLVGFYGAGGFAVLPPEHAPAFLAERLSQYRKDGGDVLLMVRREKEPGKPRVWT